MTESQIIMAVVAFFTVVIVGGVGRLVFNRRVWSAVAQHLGATVADQERMNAEYPDGRLLEIRREWRGTGKTDQYGGEIRDLWTVWTVSAPSLPPGVAALEGGGVAVTGDSRLDSVVDVVGEPDAIFSRLTPANREALAKFITSGVGILHFGQLVADNKGFTHNTKRLIMKAELLLQAALTFEAVEGDTVELITDRARTDPVAQVRYLATYHLLLQHGESDAARELAREVVGGEDAPLALRAAFVLDDRERLWELLRSGRFAGTASAREVIEHLAEVDRASAESVFPQLLTEGGPARLFTLKKILAWKLEALVEATAALGLGDSVEEVQLIAKILVSLGGSEAALVKLLDAGDDVAVIEAVRTLERVGSPRCIGPLEALAKKSRDDTVRMVATDAAKVVRARGVPDRAGGLMIADGGGAAGGLSEAVDGGGGLGLADE